MLNNDWIVANIQNPDYTTGMFSKAGLDTENTQMLSEDSYLKSNFIIKNPYFADKNGNFDKDKFHDFYTDAATGWKQLQTKKNIEHVYDFFDPEAPEDAKKINPLTGDTKDLQVSSKKPFGDFLKIVSYNDKVGSIGVGGFNAIEAPTKSAREEAQGQSIFDFSDKKTLDVTPDDQSLFSNPFKFIKSIFSDPLVLATYDEDTKELDKFTGEMVTHKKGDLKLNSNGKPYYETLAGRNPYSKQVLSTFDNLTAESSVINKYDFFDSDDLEKSISGSLAKNLMGVAPMLMGPEVAAIYSGALVARELLKTAPMVWGMVNSLWSNQLPQNSTLNGLEAKMMQATGSSSDHANANMGFTMETVLNLMGDVALQWGQQQQVAGWTRRLLGGKKDLSKAIDDEAKVLYDKKITSIFENATTDAKKQEALLNFGFDEAQIANLLKNSGKDATDAWKMTSVGQAALKKASTKLQPKMEKLNRLGANASLAYMALVSNTDVYQSALENGASAREAAALAAGATLGMYTVDRLGIGEVFFDELAKQSAREINTAIMANKDEWIRTFLKQAKESIGDANKFKQLIVNSRNKVAKLLGDYKDDLKYHTTGVIGKAIGEGLEEVSEDVVTDLANSTYAMLHELGITQSNDIMGFGYDKELNDGKGGYDIARLLAKYGMSFTGGTLGGGLFYGVNAIKSGTVHAPKNSQDMLYLVNQGKGKDIVDRIEQYRKRGAFGSTTISASKSIQDSQGDNVNITIDGDLSVNDYIAKQLINQVRSYQTIIDDNNLNKSEDELFDHMIMQDKVFRNLSSYLQKDSYVTRYQQSWLGLANDVLIAQKGLEVAASARNGEIPKEVLEQLGSSKSSKQLIDELGEARLSDSESRHNPSEESKRNVMVQSWQKYLQDKKNALKQFESPENSAYYTEMLMFGLDDNLSSTFGVYNFTNWLYYNHGGITENQLTKEQLAQYKLDYESYLRTKKPLDLQKSFEGYKHFQKLVDPELQMMAQEAQNFESYQQKVTDLIKTPTWWLKLSNPKLRQDWESEEEFKDSTTKKENESDAEFAVRLNDREIKIQTERNKKLNEVLDFVRTTPLDSLTARQLKISFAQSAKSIKSELVKLSTSRNTQANYSYLWDIIKKTIDNYEGGDTKQLGEDLKENVSAYIHGGDKLMFNAAHYWDGTEITSLFGDDDTKFGQVIKDYLISKGDATKLPEKYTKDSEGNNIDTLTAFNKLFNEADGGLYLTESSTGKTYAQIFKDVFGEDELTRLQNSIKSTQYSYIDEEGDDLNYTIDKIDPIKWLGPEALNTLESLTTNNAATTYLRELLAKVPQSGDYDTITQSFVRNSQNAIDGIVSQAEQDLNNDQPYQVLTNISDQIRPNPVTQLMKKLPLYDSNVEKLLNKLQDQFDQGLDPTEFVIDPEDESYIPQAQQLLAITSAYIKAASSDQDLSNIYGHNKTINRFNQQHGIKVDPLAEVDENYANIYQIEIQKYQDALNGDKWSLPYISKKNLGNSLLQFEQSKKALNKVHKAFWDSVRNAFVIDGKNILDKYVSTGDDEEDVRAASNIFYDAIQEHPEYLNQILEQFTTNLNKQETANVNPKLTEAGFSNFDKAMYLIAAAGIKQDDALAFTKSFVQNHPDIVPLDTQFQIAKLGMAVVNNPKLIQEAISNLSSKAGIELPTLSNTIFVPGIGGSGKTSVVAKMIAEYAKDKKLYMAAPEKSQAKNLELSLGQTGALTESQLMALVTDDTSIKNSIDGIKDMSEFKNLDKIADKISLKDAESGVLIIDEYTHFDTLSELVLDKWAKKNGIVIIGFGDNSQKGYINPNQVICSNDSDTVFMLRASRLGVSLRNGNIQQVSSTQQLDNITQQIYGYSYNITPETVRTAYDTLKSWQPRYYNQDTFNGTYIGKDFKEWTKIFNGASQNSIAFIGSDTAFNKLSAPAGIIKRFSNIKEVQGSEFNYIIYEGDIAKIPSINSDPNNAMGNALIFARDLYTVISRGKKGAIILSDNSSFNSRQDISTATTTDLKARASEEQKKFLEYLNGLTLNPTTSNTTNATSSTTNTTPPNTVTPAAVVNAASGVLLSASLDPEHTVAEDSKTTKQDKVEPNIENQDRIYGNFSMLGLDRDTNKNWIVPQNETHYEDVGVIANLQAIIGQPIFQVTTGKQKNDLVKQLLLLKDALMRIKLIGGQIKNYKEFISDLMVENGGYLFSEEAYKTLKYQVHIRPKQDIDKLVGYSKLNDNRMTIKIDEKDYLATVEATWINNGVANTITLGAIPALDTYKKAAENAAGTTYGETLKKNYIRYNQALHDILYKERGVREIKAPNNVITELKDIGDPIPFALVPKVIYEDNGDVKFQSKEGDYSPDFGDPIPELLRLPYASISSPLTYFGNAELPGVNSKIAGRTIYLVSSKPGLSDKELVDAYYAQKFAVDRGEEVMNKLDVRMIVPTERGISFTGMANAIWRDRFSLPANKTHQTASSFPANAGILGMKLFAQAWNTRANALMVLDQLEQDYDVEETNKNLGGVQQFRLLPSSYMTRGNNAYKAKETFYKISWDFNEVQPAYEKWLKSKGKPVEQWIRDYEGKKPQNQKDFEDWQKSLRYDDNDKLKNYIYITPEYLKHLYKVTDALLDPFKDFIKIEENTNQSLNVKKQLLDIKSLYKNCQNGNISEGEAYFPTEDGGNVMVTFDYANVKYESQLAAEKETLQTTNFFKVIPLFFTKGYKFALLGPKSEKPNPRNGKKLIGTNYYIKYKLYGTRIDQQGNKVKVGNSKVYKTFSEQKLIEEAKAINNNTEFSNIFNLIFHGTSDPTGNISGKHNFTESSAYFKNGIYYYPYTDYADGTNYEYGNSGQFYFRKIRGDVNNISAFYQTNVIPIPIADFDIESKVSNEPVSTNIPKKQVTPSELTTALRNYQIEDTGDVEQNIKKYMINSTIQKEISLGNLPIFTYINGKCKSCQAIPLEDDEGRLGIRNIQTATSSKLIKITPEDYETLFEEPLDTQDVEIMMYIDNDGQLKRVEKFSENTENHSLSSEEFQIMKTKIQNNSKNFIEEGLMIAPEDEEYSNAKEMFNAVLKADNESDFITALNDFRDNLLGGAFTDISDAALAKYLDDIYETYKSDGNLRNVCNIITVLK